MTRASWASDLVRFLLPAGCVACGTWIPGDQPARVCLRCRSRLRSIPSPACDRCGFPRGTGRSLDADCRGCREWGPDLDFARSAFVLDGPVSGLVHALKYRGWPELAAPMGEAMARLPLPVAEDRRLRIVPVPTTPRRVRTRGYNQAAALAEALAKARGTKSEALLVRVRAGGSQTTLDPSRRRANVAGVFGPTPSTRPRCRGAHILLVDDVLTTGATAAAAARVLRRHGAAGVGLLTYARALPEHARSAA